METRLWKKKVIPFVLERFLLFGHPSKNEIYHRVLSGSRSNQQSKNASQRPEISLAARRCHSRGAAQCGKHWRGSVAARRFPSKRFAEPFAVKALPIVAKTTRVASRFAARVVALGEQGLLALRKDVIRDRRGRVYADRPWCVF